MPDDVAAQVASALRSAHLLHKSGRLEEARAACLEALRLRPGQAEALNLLGIIAAQTGDMERAVARFGEALQLEPRNVATLNNHGNALRALRRPEAALSSYRTAISIQPQHAASHYNRGRALADLQRYAEAVASYDAAIALQPDYAAAHFDRGRALVELQRYEAAIASLDRAIALKPGHPGAHYVRANALYSLERFEDALESYDRAIALQPGDARAHHNRGNTLLMLERPEGAAASYDRAIALDPDTEASYGARLHARMRTADWREFAPQLAAIAARIERDEAAASPFTILASSGSAALQLQAAQNWVRKKYPPGGTLAAVGTAATIGPLAAHSRRDIIRVGYFSADFRSHATAFLTAELFEIHDRSRLELTAFSLGPATGDEMRKRLEAAFDRFLDVRQQSDQDIARLARDLQIDIAVDLNGFTRGGRAAIFALRAAPLQVSYLGYLGTMSAPYVDYLIADDVIIPETHRRYFSEKIVHLPSYQVNDSKRRIAERVFGREELGLPATGFVFCCFNGTYKITPGTFDGWMRILTRVPGSVLYLLGGNESLQGNLHREASARGVAAERIVFGARLPAPEYLARYRTADLFLDTLPYNAGTTASDALWAGLPVLTCMGEAFASRVGASLLQAIGLPELITTTREQYEQRAVELATHPLMLSSIRTKLAGNLRTAPLFDTAASARHLEAAYASMFDRHHAGLAPDHIRIDP